MAGQVLSYSSATSKFQLKWTDGTTSTLTLSEVVEILLPPTPVSVADSARAPTRHDSSFTREGPTRYPGCL